MYFRAEFDEKDLPQRISKVTGELENYVPVSADILHYSISSIACILMVRTISWDVVRYYVNRMIAVASDIVQIQRLIGIW